MIQHNMLEVVNLQMERFLFWHFSNAWLLCFITFICSGWPTEIFINVN